MKELLVLRGPGGEIVATAEYDDGPDALEFVPSSDQSIERIQVADDYAADIDGLYARLQHSAR
jgi:hypothetical protein